MVYDSVGKDSYRLSLGALAPLGTFVSLAMPPGAIDAVVPGELALGGSLYFTRPTLATHMMRPGWMQQSAARIFGLMVKGFCRSRSTSVSRYQKLRLLTRHSRHGKPLVARCSCPRRASQCLDGVAKFSALVESLVERSNGADQ